MARNPGLLTELSLPPHNRPEGGLKAKDRFRLTGELTEHARTERVITWKRPIPVGSMWLSQGRHQAPFGMTVAYRGQALAYRKSARVPNSWWTDGDELFVRLESTIEPLASELTVHFPRAAAHSRLLNDATDPRNGEEFAVRMQPMGDVHRFGTYLPAPSNAKFAVTLAPGTSFRTTARILRPAVDEGHVSDGVTLTVSATTGDAKVTQAFEVMPGEPTEIEVPLGSVTGEAQLTIATTPGDSAVLDYLFLEEPRLRPTERARGRKIVMVFLDTVRTDHTSVGDYERPTTPALAKLSEQAAVFPDARGVAAWTLPSSRAALSGRHPEHWPSTPVFGEILAEEGFRTAFLATNSFTAAEYEMERGFSHHGLHFLEPADQLTDRAIALLEENEEDDYALVVQYMDAHLPYLEPPTHRKLWAADKPPAGLGSGRRITLPDLRQLPDDPEVQEAARSYLVDRYDQNIRFIDDQLARLFDALHPDDIVVVFSDHGEEFLEHGYWEHGHTLYDEIVRVPLVIRAPGLQPGVIEGPTSLLDIVPTLMELLESDAELDFDGISLVSAAAGDPDALAALAGRRLALGRTLYYGDEWAAVADGKKWITTDGEEQLYDLGADPGEQLDLAQSEDLEPWVGLLAEGIGAEAGETWLLQAPGRDKFIRPGTMRVEVAHPDGLTAAWRPSAYQAIEKLPALRSGVLTMTVGERGLIAREAYMLGQPGVDPEGMTLKVTHGGVTYTGVVSANAGTVLAEAGPPHLKLRLVRARVPLFRDGTIDTHSDLMSEALKELGYLDE